jgi:hypothetical protein
MTNVTRYDHRSSARSGSASLTAKFVPNRKTITRLDPKRDAGPHVRALSALHTPAIPGCPCSRASNRAAPSPVGSRG